MKSNHVAEKLIASRIHSQMSRKDILSFSKDDWREGVSNMLVDTWEGYDCEKILDLLDNMTRLVRDREKKYVKVRLSSKFVGWERI